MLEIMHHISALYSQDNEVESTVYLMHPKPENIIERALSSLGVSAGFSRYDCMIVCVCVCMRA